MTFGSNDTQAIIDALDLRVNELEKKLADATARRSEVGFERVPPFQQTIGVPLAKGVQILEEAQDTLTTNVALTWEVPNDPGIEVFELWASNVAFDNSEPYKVTESARPPLTAQLQADKDTTVILYLRTRMKNGLTSQVTKSPTVTTTIARDPFSVADGSIGDAKLDRTTDPITIVTNDIDNAAITTAKIGTAAITTAKIGAAQITTALIANLAVTNALIANATIQSAKIANLDANKINAGTITSVNVSAGTYSLTSGSNQMQINGTNGFHQISTTANAEVKILGGEASFASTVNSRETTIAPADITGFGTGGSDAFQLFANAGTRGVLVLSNAGTDRAEIGVNSSGDGYVQINGSQVLGPRGATISDPSGGATVDSQARTAINTIIDRLQAHGLIS